MLIGFLLTFSVVDKAWQRFQTNPMFTSLILNQNKVKITFPTISVCPNMAEDHKKVLTLIKQSSIRRNSTMELEELLSAIPNFSYGNKGLKSIITTESVEDDIDRLVTNDPRSLAFQLAVSCNNLFLACKFKSKIIDCCKMFHPVVSEKGFCFSFNSRFYSTVNAEYDYH